MSRKRGSPRYPEETRKRALELAEKRGLAAASRELSIPYGTIKWWRHRAGQVGPPKGADPESWAAKKREGAEESWSAARSALDRVKVLLSEGEERKAKDAALTMAIMLDKSAALEQASALAEERQARFKTAQVEALAEALLAALDDLGFPRQDDAMRDVIAHHLRPLEDPEAPNGPAPTAEEARRALTTSVVAKWEQSLPPEERLALPPGKAREPTKPQPREKPLKDKPDPREQQTVEGKAVEKSADELRREEWNKHAGPARVGYGSSGLRRG